MKTVQVEASCIFYKKDRFDLVVQNTFWLSETPYQLSKGWDAAYRRVCTYGYFFDKVLNTYFYVFNTHLDHMGDIARTKSIELIMDKINRINNKNLPVFFMGDLNSLPDTERIINLRNQMDDCRLVSVLPPFGPEGTFNGFEFTKPVTQLIDYIFKSKNDGFTVEKYAILSDNKNLLFPSDHFPVFVILTH